MTQRKKILVLTSTYPRWENDHEPGFVHELAKRLVAEFDVLVLTPHAENAETCEVLDEVNIQRFRYAPGRFERLVNNGGIMTNLQKSRLKWLLVPFFFIAFFFAARKLIARNDFAAIHAHWIIPQGLIAVLATRFFGKRIPVLVTSHGADLYALRGKPMLVLKQWILKHAAFVAVVSSGMLSPLALLGVELDKTGVLPMGVDMSGRFTPDADTPRSRNKILFVGRLVEKKGLRVLVDALPEIIKRIPEAVLEIAGFGPEESNLRSQVKNLALEHKVIFCGAIPQNELPGKYRRAAVCVAPFVQSKNGDQDGLGLVMVEAIGCGCPVITSNLPATADVIKNEAMRVASGEVAALADTVVKLLSMTDRERSAIASEQIKSVIKCLSWEHVAEGYGQILEKLARQDNGMS